MEPKREPEEAPRAPGEEPEGIAWKGALAVALIVGGLVVWRMVARSEAPPAAAPAAPSASAGASAGAAPPPEAQRCSPAAPEPFVIGEARKAPTEKPEGAANADDAPEEQLVPFAVEVGRGAVVDGGFAVGALRQAEGGTVAMVATLRPDGSGGKLVRLARSRGDLDPPVVAGAGDVLLVAMLEPNAGGRAIKIARVTGDDVTWGAELSEGRDESLALDVAVSGERALVVWDDVTRDGERSRVMMASVDAGSVRSATAARPISPAKTDAEAPRIIARPGGYWLAYIARSEEGAKAKGKKDPDEDTESAGETIGHQWIEVLPLDAAGSPTGGPRPVTPKDGHVLAFDLSAGEDGGLLVAYRDDDTPSGSSGGRVSSTLVGLGGIGEPRVIADEDVGTGVPALLPGWIAVANVSGPTRLAAINAKGEIVDELRPEPAIGHGEPIAATKEGVLVARPAGAAMKLEVLRCAAGKPRPAEAPASEEEAPAPEGLPPEEE